eukprot:8844259-Pyramimonas_sp.AAC.1
MGRGRAGPSWAPDSGSFRGFAWRRPDCASGRAVCGSPGASSRSPNAHVVSDHLSAVLEGQSWDPGLAASGGRHAAVWRQIFQLYGSPGPR